MEDWADRFAAEIGEDALAPEEVGGVLRLARVVAHGTDDRRLAPLAAYLAGVHAARRATEGAVERGAAFSEALRAAERLLPQEEAGSGAGS